MNIFVVVTPFHLFVVRRIIEQYYVDDENLIVSTIKQEIDTKDLNVLHIERTLKGILHVWQFKCYLKRNMQKMAFFVPHLGTLFSSYMFELSKKYGRPINVYYEGLAMFYDPVVPNVKAKRERMLAGLLMGIRYIHHSQLYPDDFVKRAACCFSPKNICLEKYRCVKLIELKAHHEKDSSNILVLTSNTATLRVVVDVCGLIGKYCDGRKDRTVYVKPHYELSEQMVQCYVEHAKSLNVGEIVLLDKFQPIEVLYSTFSFGTIISQAFSSALINANMIFGDGLRIVIYDKNTIVREVVEKMKLAYE